MASNEAKIGEAKIKFLDGDFEVMISGTYIICAITGRQIALEDLRYWSVDRQEAYIDAEASIQAELAHRPEGRHG